MRSSARPAALAFALFLLALPAMAAPARPGILLPDRHAGNLLATAFSPDGQWAATAGEDDTVRIWHLATRTVAAVIDHAPWGPRTLAFSTDGKQLALGWDDGRLELRTRDGEPIASVPRPGEPAHWMVSLRLDADGAWIGEGVGRACRWEPGRLESPTCVGLARDVPLLVSVRGRTFAERTMEPSPGAARWAVWGTVVGADSTLRRLDGDAPDSATLSAGPGAVAVSTKTAVRVHPLDGTASRALATGPGEIVGSFWAGPDLVVVRCTRGVGQNTAFLDRFGDARGKPTVSAVVGASPVCFGPVEGAVSPDGRWAVLDNQVFLDLRTGETHEPGADRVDAMVWPDGKGLSLRVESSLRTHTDKRVRVFTFTTGDPTWLTGMRPIAADAVVATLDGALLVTRSYATATAFDAATRRKVAELVEGSPVDAMAASRDRVLLARNGGDVTVWNPATGSTRAISTGIRRIRELAVTPDGRQAAIGDSDGQVWVWDLETGKQTNRAEVRGDIASLTFDARGRLVVGNSTVASRPIASPVFDPSTGVRVAFLPSIAGGTSDVVACPDGLLVAGADHVLRRFDREYRVAWSRTGVDARRLSADLSCGRVAASLRSGVVLLLDGDGGRDLGRIALEGQAWIAASTAGEYDGNEPGILLGMASGASPEHLRGAKGLRRIRGLAATFLGGKPAQDAGPRPDLVAQIGDFGGVQRISVSADGRTLALVAGVNENATVRLWDLSSSTLARSFRHRAEELDLSPDGMRLALFDGERVVIVDAASGEEVGYVEGKGGVRFDPRGRVLAVENGTALDLHDAATLSRIGSLPATARYAPHLGIAFSPDGAVVATYGETVRWFELASSRLIASVNADEDGGVRSVIRVSAGARHVACSSGRQVRILDGATGRELHRMRVLVPPHQGSQDPPRPATVSDLEFSTDGSLLFAATEQGPIVSWRVSDGQEVSRIEAAYSSSQIAASPEGRTLVAASFHGLGRFDIASGTRLDTLGRRFEAQAVADPSRLGLFVDSGSVWLWGSARATRLLGAPDGLPWRPPEPRSRASSAPISLSADGSTVAVSSSFSLLVRDRESGRVKLTLDGRSSGLNSVWGPHALDGSGGSLVVAAHGEALAQLWDVGTGRLVATLGPPEGKDREGRVAAAGRGDTGVNSGIAVAPGGDVVALYGSQGLTAWRVTSPRSPWRVAVARADRTVWSEAAAFSPDGSLLVFCDGSPFPRILAASDGSEVHRLVGQGAATGAAAWGSTALVTGGADGWIVFWDPKAGRPTRAVAAHDDEVTYLGFSDRGRILVSGSKDRTFKFWRVEPEPALLATMLIDGEDFVLVAPDGAYLATRGGLGAVGFRFGEGAFPAEQFDLALDRPADVLRALGGASPKLVAALDLARSRRLERMKVKAADLRFDVSLPTVTLLDEPGAVLDRPSLAIRAKAIDPRGSLARVHVTVDDVPIFGSAGRPVSGPEATVAFEIPIPAGVHKVQLSAVNSLGQESLRVSRRIVSVVPRATPTLHVVALGVSTYGESRWDLPLPAKDARDVAAHFRMARGFARIESHLLVDAEVTRDRVLALRAALERTRPEDSVVVFLAGHGLLARDGTFYFATHDVDFSSPESKGLAFEDVEALVDGIPARQKLVLVDACHSGEAEGPLVAADAPDGRREGSRGLANRRTAQPLQDASVELFADLRRGSGAVAIAASGAAQLAMESAAVGNGFFTRAVLEGLEGPRADEDGDGRVRVSELQAWVVRRVSEMSGGSQVPTTRRENLANDFVVP